MTEIDTAYSQQQTLIPTCSKSFWVISCHHCVKSNISEISLFLEILVFNLTLTKLIIQGDFNISVMKVSNFTPTGLSTGQWQKLSMLKTERSSILNVACLYFNLHTMHNKLTNRKATYKTLYEFP
jgi:hypothetical protein